MLSNNFIALFITFMTAVLWLRINDYFAHRGWVENHLSRKIIHIGTGPIFVLCWLLFNEAQYSRYLASLVPLIITLQFILVGLGVVKDEAAVRAMSRTGNPREILKGPMFYGIIFTLLTIIYWKDSPIGITALMILCGGDGLADIIGRRWGQHTLPWNRKKTWKGSAGMFFGSWVFSFVVLAIFFYTNTFSISIPQLVLPTFLISLVATLVESAPLQDIDNITITVAAIIAGTFLF